uniref:RAP domain-containing protein n=1 Tax=Clastoptera arizonana TaxID=38151 RepID=A0A1B6E941_9HEMI
MHLFKKKLYSFTNIRKFTNIDLEKMKIYEITSIPFHQIIFNYFQKHDRYWTYKSNSSLRKSSDENFIVADKKGTQQIIFLDYSITTNDVLFDRSKHFKVWDKELYLRIQKKPQLNEILRIMDFWGNFLPNKCSFLQSFTFGVNFIGTVIERENISKQNLIQFMHYLCFYKNRDVTQNIMNIILNKPNIQVILVKQLTLEEMCIFCNSLFTSGIRLKSRKLLNTIVSFLHTNLENVLIPENQYMLSCLVKPLRLSRYYDYSVLKDLAQKLTNTKLISSKCVAHLMALYSDCQYSNLAEIENIGDNFLLCLKYEIEVGNPRIKDIDRFLWALSNLGCDTCNPGIKKIIFPFLLSKSMYVQEWPSYFVNSVLWLEMLKCSSKDMIKAFITTPTLERILKTGHLRNIARFSLLLTSLDIENGELLPEGIIQCQRNILEPNVKKHLDSRKQLRKVQTAIFCLKDKLHIKTVKVGYQIKNLYLAGITVENQSSSKYEIEVLDNSTCLHDSDIPNGLMKLKLRLMKKMGCKILMIDKITETMQMEIFLQYIEDSLKKLI